MDNEFKNLFGDWEPGKRPDVPDEGLGGLEEGEPENRGPRPLNEKEVKVIGAWEMTAMPGGPAQTFVVLQDNRDRKVRIFIGRAEAYAISQFLDREESERPMTYDLVSLIIERLGGTVDRAIIDDIWRDTFYAKLTVANKEGELYDIDCRPSDAINIALRARAPIYMAEAVLEQSQVEM